MCGQSPIVQLSRRKKSPNKLFYTRYIKHIVSIHLLQGSVITFYNVRLHVYRKLTSFAEYSVEVDVSALTQRTLVSRDADPSVLTGVVVFA